MKPRKKVKKLILNKEDVVNLNENQMNSLKGGVGVGVVESIALSVAVTSIVYETGKDNSVWTCPTDSPPQQPSSKWVEVKTQKVCEISDVVVYAYP